MAERWTLGLAWALMPKRIGGLPDLARLCFDELLAPDYALPDPERALANPPGLAGIVHDLTLPTLLAAYRRGLYPLRAYRAAEMVVAAAALAAVLQEFAHLQQSARG